MKMARLDMLTAMTVSVTLSSCSTKILSRISKQPARRLIQPDDEDYDDARKSLQWNDPKKPRLIARCADVWT